jgi:hypothetical protein
MTPGELEHRCDHLDLVEIFPDVFHPLGLPLTAESLIWAGVLAVREPCAVAGLAAGHEHRMATCTIDDPDEFVPQILVPTQRNDRRIPGVEITPTRRWHKLDVVSVRGLPVLGRADTVSSLAATFSFNRLLAVIQDELYNDRLGLADLHLRRGRGILGSAMLTRVLREYGAGFDSGYELDSHAVLAEAGVAPPHRNVVLQDQRGVVAGPVDGYYDDGLALQVDGAPHRRRRVRLRDGAQDLRLDEMGIEFLRVHEGHTSDAGGFVRLVEGRLAATRRRYPNGRPDITVIELPGRRAS